MELNFALALKVYIGSDEVSRIYANNEIAYTDTIGIYKLSCPYRIESDSTYSAGTQAPYGTPEYNHHILFFPLSSKNLKDISFNFSTTYSSWWDYKIIRCDDDCFCLASDTGGSSFNPSNKIGTVTSNLGDISFNHNWYYSAAKYTIDGSYSAKIIHIPSSISNFDVTLGKYLCLLAGNVKEWEEIGRELGVLQYSQNASTNQKYIEKHLTATDKHYYYFIPNEKLIWYNTKYNTVSLLYETVKEERLLLPTLNIIDSISATNTTSIQTLHFTSTENTTDDIRYQCLLYQYDIDSEYQGYRPDIWSTTLDGRTPRFIIVQDPKDSKLIYWGTEETRNHSSDTIINNQNNLRSVVVNEFANFRHDSLKLYVDFNSLSFATINTIKNKLDFELDIQINPNNKNYIRSYIAIPEKYYELYTPIFYDSNENELRIYDSTACLDGTNNGIKQVLFNGENYYLYMSDNKLKSDNSTYSPVHKIKLVEND